ncbi:MAG: tetratricopeptide repeat protein [Verrucomicrobiaceae bacterium]
MSARKNETVFTAARQPSLLRPWHLVFPLFVLVFLAFSPALRFDFINYDDPPFVTENPNVNTGLSPANVKWAFASPGEVNLWNPLTSLSHQLDVTLFGLNPHWHHAVNVFWHALAAAFLFLFVRKLIHSTSWSFFIAFLWAIHPEKIQSVAWISERKGVLSGALFFASLYLFSEWKLRAKKHPVLYLFSLLLFALAAMAKPSVLPLPLILFLLFYLDPRHFLRSALSSLRPLAPFFAISLLTAGLVVYFQSQGTLADVGQDLGAVHKLSLIVISYLFYPLRFIWPVPLQLWFNQPDSLLPFFISFALLCLSIPVVLWLGRKERLILVGAALYTLLWLPVSGLVSVSNYFVTDRYSYLPQIGLILMLVGVAKLLLPKKPHPIILPVGLAAFSLLPLILLQIQLPNWKDSETLFSHEMSVNPQSFLAPIHYGEVFRNDDPEKALSYYTRAHQIDQQAGAALTKMGLMQVRLNRPGEALDSFSKATQVTIPVPEAWTQLLLLQVQFKHYKDAEHTIADGLSRYPNDWAFIMNSGNYHLLVQKDPSKALPLFLRAHAIKPHDPRVIRALASCYRALGDPGEAKKFEQLLNSGPRTQPAP